MTKLQSHFIVRTLSVTAACLCTIFVAGCNSHLQQPVNMAPPVSQQGYQQNNTGQPMAQGYQQNNTGQPMAQGYQQNGGNGQQTAGVYQWQDVPSGQQVPITRATFDQGGYQIIASTGETIVVPFVNQNLYALKFGRTSGQPYFENDGQAPTLYLQPGGYLENASAQNARWYPIPADYSYVQPMYVSIAPSWSEYVGMGWYPGMMYYGGMWGYHPYSSFAWMPGYYVSIGGSRYTSYTSYHTYYSHNTGYSRLSTVYRNYSTPRGSGFGTGRAASSQGSFGNRNRTTFGGSPSSTRGSFGSSRPSGGGFGSSRTSGSGFGSGNSNRGFSQPSGSSGFGRTPSSSSFGGNRSTSGSFGGSRRSGGSFGGRRR